MDTDNLTGNTGESQNAITEGANEEKRSVEEIYNAEVEVLESGGSGETQGGSGGETQGGLSEDQKGSQESDQGEGTQEGTEYSKPTEGSQTEEKGDEENVKWKKEANETKEELASLRKEMKEFMSSMASKEPEPKEKLTPVEIPEVKVDLDSLTPELKDLLEYTPGLTDMITDLAAKSAAALVEKSDIDRATKLKDQESAQSKSDSDAKYWGDMETWFSNEFPDLSLSDIKNSPDFQDWMDYRKSWTDNQLGGVAYDDISGAQKVFSRYISDEVKRESVSEEKGRRNLAAARSPSAGNRGSSGASVKNNAFMDEVKRIKNQNRNSNTI